MAQGHKRKRVSGKTTAKKPAAKKTQTRGRMPVKDRADDNGDDDEIDSDEEEEDDGEEEEEEEGGDGGETVEAATSSADADLSKHGDLKTPVPKLITQVTFTNRREN
jgi:hypothetical protein